MSAETPAAARPVGPLGLARRLAAPTGPSPLDTPKSLAFDDGGVLYVADGAYVRRFDRHTGAPLGDWLIPDAVGLNDTLWTGEALLFTDFSTGSLVEVTRDGEVTTYAIGGTPNGIVECNGEITVADWVAGHLSTWNGSELKRSTTLSAARLDGMVCDDDGCWWPPGTPAPCCDGDRRANRSPSRARSPRTSDSTQAGIASSCRNSAPGDS